MSALEQHLFDGDVSAVESGAGDADHTVVVHTGVSPDHSDLDAVLAGYCNDNIILEEAAPLMAIAECLVQGASHREPEQLRRYLVAQLESLTERLEQANCDETTALVSRYMLCVVLDELVMTTPWGKDSRWSRDSLLWTFHEESWGGEKFFEILERLLQNPHEHVDLIELAFQCLQLGFTGKHGIETGSTVELLGLSRRCFVAIEEARGKQHTQSLHMNASHIQPGHVARRLSPKTVLWAVVAAWCATVGYFGWVGYGYAQSEPVFAQPAAAKVEEAVAAAGVRR